jgi:small subunit ribosomal protein S5
MSENKEQNIEVVETASDIVKDEKKRREDFRHDRKNNERRERAKQEDEFDKELVDVRRVAKVVKGGKTMRFSALVVVGNRKGLIGIGTGKAREVPTAIDKATMQAKNNLKKVNIVNGTIPHEIIGKYGSSRITMFPGKDGCGVIAGGSARPIIELAGIKDIVTKIHGSSNKINCVRATLKALTSIRTREEVAAVRGKPVEEI